MRMNFFSPRSSKIMRGEESSAFSSLVTPPAFLSLPPPFLAHGRRDPSSSAALSFIPGVDVLFSYEVVSKLQKRQEKCDFQGCKRAVADEIHGALRWRACHASRIAPMLPTPNGIGSNVWFPGPLVRAAPAKMSGKCSMGFCMSCTRGAAGRTCRTTSARRPRLATGGCWSTNAVGSGNAWWRTY